MKISYNWLQTYFTDKLPAPKELAELITFHAFEIEGVEQAGADTVLDIKVLPDRAHYALSHRGLAYEVSAITKIPWHEKDHYPAEVTSDKKVSVSVEDKELCLRYISRYIENVNVTESPVWLKQWLEAVGQRSINTIVDATNFVMLDLGQPLHAFDADKVKGGITVRRAKQSEKITTLDGREIELDSAVMVIADDEGPLAIAGVKGGSRAAVTEMTKNIILESASFNASFVRKVSQKVGIRNDSSKRFENSVPPERALRAMEEITAQIVEMSPEAKIGANTDIYGHPFKEKTLEVSKIEIYKSLGIEVPESDIDAILGRLHILYTKKHDHYILTIPRERLDLVIPEDLIEEIGRIYGYLNIKGVELPHDRSVPKINKLFYYANVVRDVLTKHGFSEVYTYSLTHSGEVEIQNPLASDKNFLRKNLTEGIAKSLGLNVKHADLLGLKQIKIFEIGNVFTGEGEYTSFAIGIRNAQKLKIKEADELKEVAKVLGAELGLDLSFLETENGVTEVKFDNLIRNLPEPGDEPMYEVTPSEKTFKTVSHYPFAVRDIAVFTPEGTTEHEVRAIIEQYGGALLVKETLFDVFEKTLADGTKKTSYAFRLVFQSHEKTLTEEEINSIMKSITDDMNAREGWQVR
ncbi:MAG: phenylalanine--tRNA ligase subunit beta [bacterium]|nr:phenylalanine--tRNA ligase subunit beta [bacterium]